MAVVGGGERWRLFERKWKGASNFQEREREREIYFAPVVNLASLFLCPTKRDKVLFHKVFRIKETMLAQPVAICFHQNSSSQNRRGKGARRERIPLFKLGEGGK